MSNKASVLFSFSRKLKVFLKRLQNKKLLRRSKDFFFFKKQTNSDDASALRAAIKNKSISVDKIGRVTAKLATDNTLQQLHLENTRKFLLETEGRKLDLLLEREVFLSAVLVLSVAQFENDSDVFCKGSHLLLTS